VQKLSFLLTVQSALLATSLLTAQTVGGSPKVLLKEIHFTGDLGLPISELQEYTQYLLGHHMVRVKLLEEVPSAAAAGLRHRGYWKSQVTPQLHTVKPSSKANDAEVALELTVRAGKQYRVKDITFAGHSTELPQADLQRAISNIKHGDIADAEILSVAIGDLGALFQRKGKTFYVIPNTSFDDAASTVSVEFDIEQ
jgi:hemolysin activation/secretion protein